jgi:hypothetical protein
VATNEIRYTFLLPDAPEANSLEWLIEDREGCLLASITKTGWLTTLPYEAQSAFLDVLSGMLKLAGVMAFKAHTAWQVGCLPKQIEIFSEGLEIVQKDGTRTPIVLPEAFLENVPLLWRDWVLHWDKDQRGDANPGVLLLRPEMIA